MAKENIICQFFCFFCRTPSTNKEKMEKLDALNQVAEFHHTFQHPVEEEPVIPAPERQQLRIALLAEELEELKKAVADQNLVEIADALCDLQYVLSGAVLEFGLGDKFKALFDEVHRSNMSKSCDSEEEVLATMKHYEKRGFESYYKKVGVHYLVFRKGDHKTLKSVNYSPADLESLI
jgi:predicted HAD superfamily Cof-like phosphohydrolase